MVLDRESASLFIAQYTRVLGAVRRLTGAKPASNPIEALVAARKSLEQKPALLDDATLLLEDDGEAVPTEVLHAIQGNRLRYWVYLRDTRTHSIFISPEQREAFGVLGLTDRIRDLLGSSGVAFRTGVVEFRGQYVYDGLVENHVWLGANYKRGYAELLKELREEGRVHVRCQP